MIIRLSVADNDFSEHLENFTKNLFSRLLGMTEVLSNKLEVIDDKLQEHYNWQRTFNLFNPNITTEANLTEEDKLWLTERIKTCLSLWAERLDEDDRAFVEDLEVTIGYDFKDKWENGEAVYYFSNSGSVICQ